jgi:hypothetical protein
MTKIFDESNRIGYGIANIGWQENVEKSLGVTGLISFGYISGYKDAADDLVEKVLRTELMNSYVFPIVFLYRQYTELLLKNMYFNFVKEDRQLKSKFIKKHGHRLCEVWKKVKPLLIEAQYSDSDIEYIESLINEFEKFDAHSFNFRYYVNKDFTPTLPTVLSVNLKMLKEVVDKVDTLLHGTYAL